MTLWTRKSLLNSGEASASPISPAEIRRQSDRTLGSARLARSPRLSSLLCYLVEVTQSADHHDLKEYVVGVEAFGRPESYDPRIDPIVRVEMSRLRRKLREYYENEGREDPLEFVLPKGSYIPLLRRRQVSTVRLWSDRVSRRLTVKSALIAGAAVLAFAALASWWSGLQGRRIDAPKHPTDRTQNADESYRLGQYFLGRRSEKSFPKAVSHFEEAIAQNPDHAQAYAGLADAYMSMGGYGQISPRQTVTRVRFAAARALEIDRGQAEAWASLAHASAFLEWNWTTAGRQFEQALRLDPNCVKARHWYALWLMNQGESAEAIRQMETALALDPASMIVNNNLGLVYFMARRFEDSVAQYRKTIELDTGHYVPYWGMGRALEQMGRYEESIAALRQSASMPEGRPLVLGNLGHALAISGRAGEAAGILEELNSEAERINVSPFWKALIQLGLGDRDAAFESLRAAAEEKPLWMAGMKVEPLFDEVRDDPRFDDLLVKMRLTDSPP